MEQKLITLFKNINISPERRIKLWNNILTLFRQGTAAASEAELKGSILESIQGLCDFSGEEEKELIISELYNAIKEGTPEFWNKSMQDMIQYLIDNFFNNHTEKKYGVLDLTKDEILHQDAGNSFIQNPWVTPEKNIDGKTYEQVRKHDSVLEVLKDQKYLQFTCEQDVKEWIRLIMPQYNRRVEIEDLDRNFWTAAQALATLSSYLLDPTQPFPTVLNKAVDEIAQLWENMIYLWIEVAYLSQKRDKKARVVFFYLNPNNPNQFYRKFDNFDLPECYSIADNKISNINMELVYEYVNNSMTKSLLNSYRNKYSDENLILVPIVRLYNYYNNYYSTEIYTKLYSLHKSNQEWQSVEFYNNSSQTRGLVFSLNSNLPENITSSIGDYISAVKEKDFGYKLYYNFNKVSTIEEVKQELYYGAARVVPQVDISAIPGGFSGSISFLIEDAASSIGASRIAYLPIMRVVSNDLTWKKEKNVTFRFDIVNNPPQKDIDIDIKRINYNQNLNGKSLYLGEVPSYFTKSAEKPLFEDAAFEMVKIGDAYPSNIKEQYLVPITKPSGAGYTTDTYGKGGYYCPLSYLSGGNLGQSLSFFAYSGSSISKLSFSQLTPDKVTALGISQLKSLYQQDGVFTQTSLIATKIGLGFWVGAGGSVWSYGIVTDLFAIIKGEQEPVHLSVVNRLDGYWNMKTTDTGQYTISVDNTVLHVFHQDAVIGRYRNLTLRADKVLRKYTDNTTVWEMTGGEWIWNDHTQGDIVVAKCQMDLKDEMLTTQNSYYLSILPSADSTTRTDNYDIRTDIAIPLKNNDLSALKGKSVLSAVIDYFDGHGTVGAAQFGYNPANKIFE